MATTTTTTPPPPSPPPPPLKICFITAIYGGYEKSCKKFAPQTVKETDFVCFTDNPKIISNGWTIDTTPYHTVSPSPSDDGLYTNSMTRNRHTFNVAKYYKQAFLNIARLKHYDVIVWLDGTVEIHNSHTAEWIIRNIETHKIIGWEHENRRGKLQHEMEDSRNFYRYSSTFWNNQVQPYQNVKKQYDEYVHHGYDDTHFFPSLCSQLENITGGKKHNVKHTHNLGVWITCFVAFHCKNPKVVQFLDNWYLQTLKYTTQDQIGFSYCVQTSGIIPHTLPDDEIKGERPHNFTDFYIKHNHGN